MTLLVDAFGFLDVLPDARGPRPSPDNRRAVPALIWPACFVAVGLLPLTYREVR